jgi:hypothetical protein
MGSFTTTYVHRNLNHTAFVLYSLHILPHPIGPVRCDVWTSARVAGHSSIPISTRYVDPSEDAVLEAMERLGGHNSGHSPRKGDS